MPKKIAIYKSWVNTAVIQSVMVDACFDILMFQNKHLQNIV